MDILWGSLGDKDGKDPNNWTKWDSISYFTSNLTENIIAYEALFGARKVEKGKN